LQGDGKRPRKRVRRKSFIDKNFYHRHLSAHPLQREWASARRAAGVASRAPGTAYSERSVMNLVIWLPALLLLGLGTMGLMFAFVSGCEKV
jgi:hypothetical protein